jgi:hypothetical protein
MSGSFDALKLSLPIESNALAARDDARRTATALGVLHLGVASTHHLHPANRRRFDALKYIWAFGWFANAKPPDADQISGDPVRCT